MGQNDEGRPGVSDEEWARFSAQAGEGGGDAPREPSARARMVTERLRREEADRAQTGRGLFRRAPRAGAGDPPGWRTGPAWQEREGRGRGKRRLKATAAVVGIAALALVAVRPELLIDRITGKAEDREDRKDAAAAAPLAAESARPSAPPAELYPDQPTLTHPFRGSPALQWADGAAGIEVPEAAATGGMTKEQVADALAKTKQFLVAANLDPATLRGEQPAAALALMDPKDKTSKEHVAASFARPGTDQNPLDLFSRYDPAELKLAGDVVKVRGRMWVEPGEGPGQAHVRVDYSFVYPFTKAQGGSDQVERTIVRREATFSIADPRKWTATAGKLWLVAYHRDIANSSCDKHDGFLHPGFTEDPATGTAPSGTPVDPYDRSKTIEESSQEGCTTISRS
ncbi:hypothetical protein ACFWTC_35340 [Streptomyces sp. NPDC058619]|uniref:hypothetical protein n=1 Tax=Streptomyces sp. NPDC058619 TaxID=3346559 RepID=UPI003646760D